MGTRGKWSFTWHFTCVVETVVFIDVIFDTHGDMCVSQRMCSVSDCGTESRLAERPPTSADYATDMANVFTIFQVKVFHAWGFVEAI